MSILLLVAGWTEIKYRMNTQLSRYWQLGWPVVLALIGLLFIFHPQHGTSQAIIKAHAFHQSLGLILITAGVLRKVQLDSKKRLLNFVWIIALAVAAIMLITYREPEGSYHVLPTVNSIDSDNIMQMDRQHNLV